jgi:hypothetical protein
VTLLLLVTARLDEVGGELTHKGEKSHRLRMHRRNAGIPGEVRRIEGKNVCDAVDVHGRSQSSVIYLNAAHTMYHHEMTPLDMDRGAIRQKGKDALNKPRAAVRLSKGEAKAAPRRDRSRAHVPELDKVL